jgi:hypothetical protein
MSGIFSTCEENEISLKNLRLVNDRNYGHALASQGLQ